MEEDIKLIEEYISGCEGAIEALVMKYQKMVYAFIYRTTNDMEEAKDLTQKTFLNVINGIKGFKRESSFKTWLYAIASNTCINHLKQNRHQSVELDESIASSRAGALEYMIDSEKKMHIKKNLEALPERQRLAVILRVYEGLSCEETAKMMECSEGAVKAHYHNGVRRLRELFKERGYEIKS